MVKKLTSDKVVETITAMHGLMGPAAEQLGVTRTVLRFFIQRHPSCAKALKDAREALGDLAEQRLFDQIERGELRAITFYLSTMCKDRGYILPRGTALEQHDTNITVIEAVNVIAIPRGHMLPRKEPAETLPGQRIGGPISEFKLKVIEGGSGEDDPTIQ